MKSNFFNRLGYFANGFVIHIILAEKMTLLNAICLFSFITMLFADIYIDYLKRKIEKS